MLFLVLQTLLSADGARERDFVLALWRHGARSPKEFFTRFHDGPEKWPNLNMQLTQLGVEQHQNLGLFLRDRYKDLFPEGTGYKRKDIYVRSSDTGMNLTFMINY